MRDATNLKHKIEKSDTICDRCHFTNNPPIIVGKNIINHTITRKIMLI